MFTAILLYRNMIIDILTIFPDMFYSPFRESIIKRAKDKKLLEINIYSLRSWTDSVHRTVDDKPYGGGAGMIMKIEPIYKALKELDKGHKAWRILFTAKGDRIVQEKMRELSKKNHLILICGHYEGVDQRVADYLVDECISIGDFILTGGEIPAMALTDAVTRLIPGVLGNEESIKDESFSKDKLSGEECLEYPQYTRPEVFKADGRELKVPRVLLGGDHAKVNEWRKKMKKRIN